MVLKRPMVGNERCTPSLHWVESLIDIVPSSVPLQMWTLYTARPKHPTHSLAQLDMVERQRREGVWGWVLGLGAKGPGAATTSQRKDLMQLVHEPRKIPWHGMSP